MPTKVSILVYAGDPLDFTKHRHTALFFAFPDKSVCLMHITGSPGIFRFDTHDNYDPDQSRRLASKIEVAELPDETSQVSIRGVVAKTPIKNGVTDGDWNCQNWVADALTRMVKSGFLGDSQREAAIDKMTDACLEAKDEQ